MPRTLASYRPSPEQGRPRGFTLLELLVVLALVALVTGMVTPAVVRGLAAARERGVARDVQALLEGLPVRAFQRGDALELDSPALRRLVPDLPEGWQLEVAEPLRYGPTGVASGGTVRLRDPGRGLVTWRVLAVSGEVVPVPGTGLAP